MAGRQAGSGLGLDAQGSTIAAAAAWLGLTLGEMFTDAGLSGGLAQRPAPMRAKGWA